MGSLNQKDAFEGSSLDKSCVFDMTPSPKIQDMKALILTRDLVLEA